MDVDSFNESMIKFIYIFQDKSSKLCKKISMCSILKEHGREIKCNKGSK